MNSAERTHSPQLPQIVSVIGILILTLFVGLCSAFVIYITDTHFSTQKGWTVCAMMVLSVLAFLGYCWYGVIAPKPPITLPFQEQMEGVWPPAPLTPRSGGNKD